MNKFIKREVNIRATKIASIIDKDLQNKQDTKSIVKQIGGLPSINSIWIVTFRQSCPGTRDDPIANGRFFEAHSVEDALEQFASWANDRKITTADVYATAISDVVDRQMQEIEDGYLGLEDL